MIVANNTVEQVAGEANIRLRVGKAQKTLPFRLVNSLSQDCILAMDFLRLFALEIDFRENTWTTPDLVEKQTFDYSEYFEDEAQVVGESAGLAEISAEQREEIARLVQRLVPEPSKTLSATNLTTHKIDVEGHAPIRQNPRRYSPKVLDSAYKILDELLELDVIEPCQSPWCSPPVMVRKANGDYRLCVDYRKLNAVTKKHAHPIPAIDSILDRMRNARYISKIDMSMAFHQNLVDPESQDITTFSVPGRGQFRYKRMSFGLTNAPSDLSGYDRQVYP